MRLGPAEVREYIPQAGSGHVRATSGDPSWRGLARPIAAKVFERPESVALLKKRTGQMDQLAATELAEEVGDLPLALEQAGAYVEATEKSLSAYVKLLRTR